MERRTRPTIVVAAEKKNDLAPIIMKYMGLARRFWYWIVLSVIVALCLGYVYQQRQNRVYQSQAVVLIEQKDAGQSTMRTRAGNSQVNTLMQLNGITAGENIQNELYIITSLRLVKHVVMPLGLDVDYTMKQSMHDVALYRERPFRVNFERMAEYPASMEVSLDEKGNFSMTNFVVPVKMFKGKKVSLTKEETASVVVAKPGQKVKTPIGVLSVEKDVTYDNFGRGDVVKVNHYTVDMAAELYRSRLSADLMDKESELIVLTCKDINSARAEDILYELIEVYKQDVIDNKNIQAERTAEFIDGRLQLISRELSAVESELATFKSHNNIADLTTTASAMTQQSFQARNAVTELNTQLSVARYLEDYLRTTPGSKDVIPVLSNFNNSAVSSQIAEYNRVLLNRNRMASNSSDESPAVREQDRQLESMRSAINSSLASYVKSVELELRAAQANEQHYVGQAGLVPVKEKQAIDIARQQSLKEALYTYLLNKREEVALQLAIEEANVRLIEDPVSSNGPISPRSKVIMLLALLLGLVVPFGVMFIWELFDTTISGRTDVEDALSLPIVGELPHMEHANDKTLVFGKEADYSAPIAEAFRLLRYGLHYYDSNGKVLLVTSSSPSHGKSFVSRNLAGAMAMTGKRVLLVDADIRVRNLTRYQSLLSMSGVTEYLIGDVNSIDDIIAKDALQPGVDIMPAGSTPPNTTELLMSNRLDTLIEKVRDMYDAIILDTTPAFAVADASIVSRVCDATLFVIRVGEQIRAGLPAIEELYKSKKCGNLCAVINDADLKTRVYGNGYGSYGYHYQYGYHHHAKRKWYEFWKKNKR